MLSDHLMEFTLPERLVLGSVLINPTFMQMLQRERQRVLDRLGLIDPTNNDAAIAEEYRNRRRDLDWINDLTKLALNTQMENANELGTGLQVETVVHS